MGRFKSKLDLLRQMYRLCRLGGMPEPKWLGPYLQLHRFGELELGNISKGKSRTSKRVQFPEDSFVQSFYHRFPHARLQPIDIDSFNPPPIKKMAVRQLALVEKGMSRKSARRKIEEEMLASGELKLPKRPSIIQQVQAEEELVLLAAIQERKRIQSLPNSS